MVILQVLILLMVLVVIGIVSFCWFRKMQLDKIRREGDQTPIFLRKLDYVEQQEQKKWLWGLFGAIIALMIGLALVTGNLFYLSHQNHEMSKKIARQEDEIFKIQSLLNVEGNVSIVPYEENAIDLGSYQWDDLFQEDSHDAQIKIETDITQKIRPYFGLSTALLNVDIPTRTISLTIVGDAGAEKNEDLVLENMDKFSKDSEKTELLNQIVFQINFTSDSGEVKEISRTYMRDE